MRLLFILIVSTLVTSTLYANEYSAGKKWKCTDKKGGSTITSIPCPVGMQSQEVDHNNNIIPNGYDPKANKQYWRCTSSLESLGHGASIYTEHSCLVSDPFNLMKYKGVRVNREGFTAEEMPVEIKRRENLAKQKEWENRHKKTANQPKVSKLLNPDELVELRGFEIIKSDAKQIKKDDCKSWMNSNVIDPTPEKKKYIKENC
jgi:hypothetical protein